MATVGTTSSPALGGRSGVTTTRRSRQSGLSDVIAFIIALFLPPLGVFLEVGCHADFWINILLTILDALYVCFFKDNTVTRTTVATTPVVGGKTHVV